ncbi:MAG: DNA-3-methyladenine glycosylase I [Actinomycetota bacterium]
MIEAARGDDGVARCSWGNGTLDYMAYHDEEWGRPVDDDRLLFEKLSLEGFQAGLSWITILRKREAFRDAFSGFAIEQVAAMGDSDVVRLKENAGIVRHEGKIRSAINNAQRALEVVEEDGSLGALVWSYEPEPSPPTVEPTTPESTALAKDLKRRGFTFVGPTTVYAFMQAMGVVNDHGYDCVVRDAVEAERRAFKRPAKL